MKHKFHLPRIILSALLAALQLCSLLSLYVIYELAKMNASAFVRLPSGAYTLQVDPLQLVIQALSTSWIWGSALLCIVLSIVMLVLLCRGHGKPSLPVAILSAISAVCHALLISGFAFGNNDPLRSLELVCFTMLRTVLKKLSLFPEGDWAAHLGLIMIIVLCVVFAAGAALSLALLLLELMSLKKSKETDHA